MTKNTINTSTNNNANNNNIDNNSSSFSYNSNIVNSYQEQTLQAAREITENFIESQKTIIKSIQSAWSPYQQNFNTSVNNWNSPQAIANVYSRLVSTFADNAVTA